MLIILISNNEFKQYTGLVFKRKYARLNQPADNIEQKTLSSLITVSLIIRYGQKSNILWKPLDLSVGI